MEDSCLRQGDEVADIYLPLSPAQRAVNAHRRSLLADGLAASTETVALSTVEDSPPELGKFDPYRRCDVIWHLQCCGGVDEPVLSELIECETFDELTAAVAKVPDGQLMVLMASNTYDCSGHYCSGGICQDTMADQFVDSLDVLGAFSNPDALLKRATSEIKKAAAHVATFKSQYGHPPSAAGTLRSVHEQLHGVAE